MRLQIVHKIMPFILAAVMLQTGCNSVFNGSYTISGRITLCDPGHEGVNLTFENERYGTVTAVTDATGGYTFYEVQDGMYTVTPYKEGYTFTPERREVTVSGGNVFYQDFITIVTWTGMYGSDDGMNASAYEIERTADCGYVVAGYKEQSPDEYALGGEYDMWVMKLDLHGDIEWERTYDRSDYDEGYSTSGETNDIAYSIRQTGEGGYVVAGKTSESFESAQAVVVKLDDAGNVQWNRIAGSSAEEEFRSISVKSDGGYIAAGYMALDSDITSEWDMWIYNLDNEGDVLAPGEDGNYGLEDQNDIAYAVREYTADGTAAGYIFAGATDYFETDYISKGVIWIVETDFDQRSRMELGAAIPG